MLVEATLYTNELWSSFKSNALFGKKHITFNKLIYGEFNREKSSNSIADLIKNSPFLNQRLTEVSDGLFWENVTNNLPVIYFDEIISRDEFILDNFDIETEPLFKIGIFNRSENVYELLFSVHCALINKITPNEFSSFLDSLDNIVSDNQEASSNSRLSSDNEYNIQMDNESIRNYPNNQTIHELFEHQTIKTPNHTAVIFEGKSIQYAELNAKSNQLARLIRSKQTIGPNTIVAICVEKSIEMVIGILGILKAGAAYVPIVPNQPIKRIQHIIEDTGAGLILTQDHLSQELNENLNINLFSLDRIDYSAEKSENLNLSVDSKDLAYVIYTSGTSGKAKGVAVEHQAANYYITLFNEIVQIPSPSSGFTLNYSFDASLPMLFSSLISGGTVHAMKSIDNYGQGQFTNYLRDNNVNVIRLTPSMLNHLSSELFTIDKELSIVLGGETINIDIVNRLIQNKNIRLYNQYGPTECVVGSTCKPITEPVSSQNIGKGYPGKRVYVLDHHNNPAPIGTVGELHIGGAGMARGYLNQPELTAQKFIPNPFASQEDLNKGYTRLYKTGDLVRLLPDGQLEYIGRNDFQVKIRGYRIELGEIENALNSIQGVLQACVIAKKRNDNHLLIGYIVCQKQIPQSTLVEQLSELLPDYMIPTAFVQLEQFPLTINGKINRKALPEPQLIDKQTYSPPTSTLEKELCSIWSEILNLDKIGIDDDFFRSGGDSILSIQLTSRLRKNGIICSTKTIFEHRTIQRLAQFIENNNNQSDTIVEQGILQGEFELLPVQQWFFDKENTNDFKRSNHWNQSFLVKVPKLDKQRLPEIIQQLTLQHDALRLNFQKNAQTYLTSIEVPELRHLQLKDYGPSQLQEIFTEWQSDFDINNGPLWSVAYLEGHDDQSSRLFFAFHHLIIDTVSWRIIIEDFKALYNGEELPKKSSSYRQWSHEVQSYAQNFPQEKDYWTELLKSIPDPQSIENAIHKEEASLSEELTQYLLQHANDAYHTEINDLLLTALGLTLQQWNNHSEQFITLEGHGREHLNEQIDLSKTVGWFTSLYPVRLNVGQDIGSSIKRIKENLRAIPNKGIGFGAILPHEQVNLPQISFNYLGQFDNKNDFWSVVRENAGIEKHAENNDGLVINIKGMVVHGLLNFNVSTRLGETETQELSRIFEHFLAEVVLHCKQQIERGITNHSPSDFSTVSISSDLLDEIQQEAKIEAIYPANSLQQGFIYHAISQPEDDAYRVQIVSDFKHRLDVEQYIRAWELTIESYPILRTAFNWQEEMIQVVYAKAALNTQTIDISHLPENEQEEYLIELHRKDRTIPFDLTIPALFRLSILKMSDEHFVILNTKHHSISDGWSEPILVKTVQNYYQQLINGQSVKPFTDRSYLEAQEYIAKQQPTINEHWELHMQSFQQTNDLSPLLSQKRNLDRVETLDDPFDLTLELSGKHYSQLKSITSEIGVTLNSVIQFAWHKLIQIYTQDGQTTVGTTVSGRTLPVPEIENGVGMFINTLPLIIDWENENTIKQQIQYIHQQTTELNNHSFPKLANLQKEGKRLFHSLFVFENNPTPSALENTIPLPDFRFAAEKLNYPITLTFFERNNRLTIKLKSDHSFLSEERAQYHLNKIELILHELTTNLLKKHTEIPILTPKEYQHIAFDWNDTNKQFPMDRTIHELFEDQVAKTPDNVALIYNDEEVTYDQLNTRSNQLAHFLREKITITPDTLIGLCMDRSVNAIVGMLAILKSGAAYLPIDPEYPEQRIQFILDDTQTELILTNHDSVDQLKNSVAALIAIDENTYSAYPEVNLTNQNNPKDLAYIIYTSGTTGNPKGVMIEHQSVVNFAVKNDFIDHDRIEIVAGLSSIVFDGSIFDIFVPLLSGKTCCITVKQSVTDLNELSTLFVLKKIDTAFFTTALLNSVVNNKIELLSSLRQVLFGGENVNIEHIKTIRQNYPDLELIHVYGPTETVVYSTFCKLNDLEYDDTFPIGKGLNNKRHYVLDKHLNISPIGAIGELHIGGAGMARGYLNQPELTAQKFIPNPFASQEDLNQGYTRLYKTGDLVRLLPDGQLEYIGRNDFQVKIRGYRIELGEIENALNSISGVLQACVIAKKRNNNQLLIGYIVCQKHIPQNILVEQLSELLPDYMIPTAFVQLEQFPLTINGKIDRKALPEPQLIDKQTYSPPTSTLEKELCSIWSEILNLDKIGIDDDFFRSGGDSILSIQLTSRLRKNGIICSTKTIFEHRTIQRLAQYIENNNNQSNTITEQGVLQGEFELLPVQQWFFDKKNTSDFKRSNHWNQSFLVKVPKLDKQRLPEIIQQLTLQHDALRLNFQKNAQIYLTNIEVPKLRHLQLKDYEPSQLQKKFTEWQSDFDINNGPLWSVAYLEGHDDQSSRLFFAFHHLIIDTVSWRIIIEDFKALYNGEELPKKSSSYRQWSHEIQSYAQNFPQEKDYWTELLKSIPGPQSVENAIHKEEASLSEELTQYLLQHANDAYNTEINDLLLTALGLTLQQWNNHSEQFITLEGHGREHLNEQIDLSKTVGWFTSLYPVQLDVEQDIGASIKSIKENLRSIPNKGIGFGAILPHEQVNLPQISFNYLGQFDNKNDFWSVVRENAGLAVHQENSNSRLIDINGSIIEGVLRFRIDSRSGTAKTTTFSSIFEHFLAEVVIHCKQQIEHGITKYSPSDFNTVSISSDLLDEIQQEAKIEAIYPANSLQQGFIYHAISQPEDDAYRVQIVSDFKHRLDVEQYIRAWELTIETYPILRTAFNWQEEMIQVVYTKAELNTQTIDISHLPENEQEEYLIELQKKDRTIPFDLTTPALFRLSILKMSDEHFVILNTKHHGISDGWSEPILVNTVQNYYQQLINGQSVKPFTDRSYLEAQEYIAKQQPEVNEHWEQHMQSFQQTNDLSPLLSQKRNLDTVETLNDPFDLTLELSGEHYSQLKSITSEIGVTLNSIVQFAWHKLIQIYTQDEQTTVGTTVSGRNLPVPEIENGVGMFINTLPLIIDWENENTIKQQIQYVHQQITELNNHSFPSLANLQKEGKRLFHSLFVFENYPNTNKTDNPLFPTFRFASEKVNYPLALTIYERNNKLILKLRSDHAFLSQERAQSHLNSIKLILNHLTTKLSQKHREISILSPEEYQQIVFDWNDTDQESPVDKTIHELFEDQVSKTPDNVALICNDEEVTYEQLNTRSNQLAHFLREQITIAPDTLIGLCMDRSVDAIVGMLAILKSGAAYLPIDPKTPEDRLYPLLETAEIEAIITHQNYDDLFPKSSQVIHIEAHNELLKTYDSSNLSKPTSDRNLAYVMFTSGSTGTPVGVMVEHQGVSRLVKNPNYIVLNNETTMLHCSPIFFDASTFEIYGSLLNGGKLVIYPSEKIDFNQLNDLIHQSRITTLWLTSALFEAWSHVISEDCSTIKHLLTGGDIVPPHAVEKVYKKCPNLSIINGYGPTENTTFTTTFKIPRNSNTYQTIPIGSPINSTRIYVLDRHKNVVPIGVTGTLYASGKGLSRGYLNNPKLSAEKFISNPFKSDKDANPDFDRLYNTGDLVKWRSDGTLEYIGRDDFQVKIRGYRIDLSEIERCMTSLPDIKNACALVQENDGEKTLVTYFQSDKSVEETVISSELSAVLPEYMIPQIFIPLENFPITDNGKLDRKALPKPEISRDEYLAPVTEIEEKLCGIWESVLNVEKVGIGDNFFHLGGNSISAMKLSHAVNSEFETMTTLSEVFQFSTVALFADIIEKNKQVVNNQNTTWEI